MPQRGQLLLGYITINIKSVDVFQYDFILRSLKKYFHLNDLVVAVYI